MRKLKTSGSIFTELFNILSEQKRFYQELYTSQSKKADNTRATEFFTNNLNIPGLTEQQRLSCEVKSLQTNVLRLWKPFNSKRPQEITEFQLNFTNTFWSLISEPFIRCANECFEKGEI